MAKRTSPSEPEDRPYTITHKDPLEFRQLPSVPEEIPPYSVCPSPYRWLREESFRSICEDEKLDIRESDTKDKEFGWVFEPDRQIELLRHFWGKLEKNKSLLFFYCNHGNPLDESLNRILLGVSRISQVGPQLFFGKKLPKYPDKYPIWSRCITHDFENQGFRLPYESRFSVLCGRAGTGKTSVLKVFLKGLEELDGKRPILLLAPTGKARVRLMDRTKRDDGSVRDAFTIHQFLMRHKWSTPRTSP